MTRRSIELEEAERLDPLDLQLKTQIGYVHYFRHDFDRAIEQFERVLALEPSFAFAHYALGDACTQTGQYDRAFAEFEKAIELGGRSVNHVGVLGYALWPLREPRQGAGASPGAHRARRAGATSPRCGSRWSTSASRISRACSTGWTAPSTNATAR